MLTWQEAFYIQTLLICPGYTMFRRKMLGRWYIGQWVHVVLMVRLLSLQLPKSFVKARVWWFFSLFERWNGKRHLSLWSCLPAVWDNNIDLHNKSELVRTCLFCIGSARGSNMYIFAWIGLSWQMEGFGLQIEEVHVYKDIHSAFGFQEKGLMVPFQTVALLFGWNTFEPAIWSYTNMSRLAACGSPLRLRKTMRSKGLMHREHFSNTKHSKDIVFACVRLGWSSSRRSFDYGDYGRVTSGNVAQPRVHRFWV